MNAIIAFCHFCELHGPSVVMCTQTFHDADDPQRVTLDDSGQSYGAPPPPSSDNEPQKRYYGRPECFQRSNSMSSDSGTSAKAADSCEACRSFPPGQTGFICNDHEAKVSYVSTHTPFHREIFSLVRQACVRSLSCEVCPGREGPIYFGDEHHGHVLSHTFFLKDSQARGFQRWYSIVIVMKDKIFLLNSWPFLVKHLRIVIDELQDKANKIYQVEQVDCPQRAVRLNNVTSMTPSNFRRQRGGTKSMRALDELTGDKEAFANLHLWFTWILKAGGNRLTEELIEGPPTEDTVIAIRQQEETEEGFTLVTMKKVPLDCHPKPGSGGEAVNDISGHGAKLRWLHKIFGEDKFLLVAYHAVVGNQVTIRSSDKELSKALLNALEILLPRGCCSVTSYSEQYIDSWKCNFLGLHPQVSIPTHVEASELHTIIDVATRNVYKDMLTPNDFKVYSVLVLPHKHPTFLHKINKAIKNIALSDRVLSFYVMSLKEEWMNKVKVLFKFTRSITPTAQETQKLLEVLGAQEQDKLVLKFWMKGLSPQYRTHVMST